MNTFPDQVLRRLEALAHEGHAIDTERAREGLGLTPQQFHRMVLQDDFPAREHIGRRWWLNPQQLADFAAKWNRLAVALTITDVARLIRSTVPTARRAARQSDFPKPLGQVNGRDRWETHDVQEWQRTRVGGAKLPPDANGGGGHRKPRKKTAKGARSGKAQKAHHPRA